ncbi:MAG: LptF/LptG family permease, partial [Planctomycetota bacterium]|nr:LptF/LptG family permease [Planctomycetota bacterium]
MPRLLYRYMLWDLIRVALLTTAVLVTVIAFGAAIKPLAKEALLTAGQTAKYIILAIVPMLQFALPFAAGFAGTMSLHRMVEDNEIVAASVSGISYRRLLLPVLALGLALMLVMILLTQWVIPRFWGLLERAVAQDVTRLFQASIERGEPFQLGDLQIWADRLIVDPEPEDTEADTRLILFRVAAAVLDDDGRVDEDVTANQAVVDIYRRPGATYVK